MMLRDLIKTLQDFEKRIGELGPQCPVLIAEQPNWPLAVMIDEVTLIRGEKGRELVVWIATGSLPRRGSPYAPKQAWRGSEVTYGEDDDDDN